MNNDSAWLIFGNQLFSPRELLKIPVKKVFMAENHELCTYGRFHQQKLVLFLSAMRHYAQELNRAGFDVQYRFLPAEPEPYEQILEQFCRQKGVSKLHIFEIEDKFMEKRIQSWALQASVELIVHQSPMFVLSRQEFVDDQKGQKKPFMKTFYERQRKKFRILMTAEGKPIGGQMSFDEDNRKALPKKIEIPSLPIKVLDEIDREVIELVRRTFSSHPGRAEEFWLPTTRAEAFAWCQDFFRKRFEGFGPYEDALHSEHPFLFHSVLSPSLNLGLLTPRQVLVAALRVAEAKGVPLQSVEGFVRQILGWREFVRGIYQMHSERQDQENFWGHQRGLAPTWWSGETGHPVLDDVIRKTLRYGYAHHIERLMVVGNLMNLSEIRPREAYNWFMDLYVDSSDWVMGPNVYGMALHSDGGIFTTKPYLCGSNYLLKMGAFERGPWCDEMDGLYWGFIDRHRGFFAKNPRLKMMVSSYDKMAGEKKERLALAAAGWLSRNTLKLATI